jgi:hypothetical protein
LSSSTSSERGVDVVCVLISAGAGKPALARCMREAAGTREQICVFSAYWPGGQAFGPLASLAGVPPTDPAELAKLEVKRLAADLGAIVSARWVWGEPHLAPHLHHFLNGDRTTPIVVGTSSKASRQERRQVEEIGAVTERLIVIEAIGR